MCDPEPLGLLPAPLPAGRTVTWYGRVFGETPEHPHAAAIRVCEAIIDQWNLMLPLERADARQRLGSLLRGLALAAVVSGMPIPVTPDTPLARLLKVAVDLVRPVAPPPPEEDSAPILVHHAKPYRRRSRRSAVDPGGARLIGFRRATNLEWDTA